MKNLHRIAFLAWLVVIIALTLLKSFYQIGYLWDPDNQRVREIILEPLDVWRSSSNWFLSVFEYGGNTALFIPFGALLFIVLSMGSTRRGSNRVRGGPRTGWASVWKVAVLAALCSFSIEIAQYAFSIGRSSTDDLLFNTLGGFLGALLAKAAGPKLYPFWSGISLALAAVFAVLVGLGERLGDPEKIVG